MRCATVALIFTIILALLATPMATEAREPGKIARIGYLTRQRFPEIDNHFIEGLRELGWVEGRNIRIEIRGAKGKMESLPDLAAELVRLKVDVILARTTPATRAAMDATRTIPIVFCIVSNPVGSGFVASLARPGGNVTGVTMIGSELCGKLLQLLMDAVPNASRVGLFSPVAASRRPLHDVQLRGVEPADSAVAANDTVVGAVEWQQYPARRKGGFEAADELEQAASGIPVDRAGTMEEAVEFADRAARSGDTVLLAPGCASFDMFRSYADRGNAFAEAVRHRKEER